MDFEQSEHLVYTRVGLVEVVDYDPRISGLVGFKNLVKLDVRGVCDNRIKEIGRVISDCIKSGTLRNVNIEIEKYWSYAMEEFELSEDMDLWDWVSGIWERTIGCGKKSGKKRKGISAPTIDVSISLDKVDWRFRTCNDYNIRTDCLTELSIHTGFLYDETLRLMTRLPVGGLPNLRKLLLKCFLNDCYELLKHTTGLEELYIINPAPIERMVAQTKDIQRQRLVAYEENRIQQPDIKKMNWILDTIAKHHLRTLEVLVIDEPIPVPRSWEAIGTINSLELWKGRGMKMKELGLSLYGPQERVSEFLGCFPRLKYLHNFMTPFSFGIQPVLGAPPAFQVTCQECFNHSAYFCNASNTAALISHAWAKELIRGRDNDKHVVGEPTRWIAIGPWWITQEAGQRWRWDEDNANRLLEWKDRPVFYGDLNAWDPQGGLGIAESPWSESRMWWALDRYLW